MQKFLNDPIKLICCACGKEKVTTDIYESGWGLHEQNEKRIDLCQSCNKRQDGREEQERQILGLPPQKIAEMTKNDDMPIVSVKKPSQARNTSGVSVQAVFKLVRINVIVGETIVKGKPVDNAIEITDNLSGSDFVKGGTYVVNLTK